MSPPPTPKNNQIQNHIQTRQSQKPAMSLTSPASSAYTGMHLASPTTLQYPAKCSPLTKQKTRLPHNPPLLDPLLPLLSHPLERRARANHERRLRPRPGHRAARFAAPDLHGPGAVLRVLCRVRSAVESGDDAAAPACMDESHCHQCWCYWGLYGGYEGCLEFIVRPVPYPLGVYVEEW